MDLKKIKGNIGEEKAVHHLRELGFSILHRNWRYIKYEIDIICENEEWIVFVEVKTRSTKEYGNPEEFVSRKQQRQIIEAAHQYLIDNEIEKEARFDVFSLILYPDNTIELEHIPHAFTPTI
jgi:putative endonuclease